MRRDLQAARDKNGIYIAEENYVYVLESISFLRSLFKIITKGFLDTKFCFLIIQSIVVVFTVVLTQAHSEKVGIHNELQIAQCVPKV